MIINIIAAVGKNLELGKDNKLIWPIKEDLIYFKEKTLGKTVVMGKNTFYSIGKALPGRNNIVLTSGNIEVDNIKVLHDYKEVFSLEEDEIYIIGGESIYRLFLPYADNLYLTEIDKEDLLADSYFPYFNKNDYYKEIIKKSSSNDLNYSFVRYGKK